MNRYVLSQYSTRHRHIALCVSDPASQKLVSDLERKFGVTIYIIEQSENGIVDSVFLRDLKELNASVYSFLMRLTNSVKTCNIISQCDNVIFDRVIFLNQHSSIEQSLEVALSQCNDRDFSTIIKTNDEQFYLEKCYSIIGNWFSFSIIGDAVRAFGKDSDVLPFLRRYRNARKLLCYAILKATNIDVKYIT